MKNRLKFIILFVLIIFPACGYQTVDQSKNPDVSSVEEGNLPQPTNTVQIVNFEFRPSTLTIKAGTTVTWLHDDKVTHTVVFPNFESSNMQSGDSFTHTFDTAGSYEYHCGIHPSMRGKVIVE